MKSNEEMIGRHSLAHIMAKAVLKLYPSAKLTIGPAIDNGFYYDFDINQSLSIEDLLRIEKEMMEIVNKGEFFSKEIVSKTEAKEIFKGNPYKLELINELPEEEKISLYYLGDNFVDLCRGPHVESTKNLQNYGFKLVKINGAYWKGNEKNKMLQRIYAYAFKSKKTLNEYIKAIEEAVKRDHNKLGRELELFTTVDIIGQGLPILMPKGAKIMQIMQRFVEDEEEKRGYLLTKTPYFAKSDLYKVSGHWDHYKDGMFIMQNEGRDKEIFALRPMTCPFQYQCYLNKPRSYKDLPLRYNETSTLFRNEASGEMHGLIRIRQFTLSEGHIICLPTQVEEEFKDALDLAVFMLKTFGLYKDVKFRFSKWDANNKSKYIGSEDEWNKVQALMEKILEDLQVDYYEADGEAAFYGPKLDIQIKNVFGKEDTIITIQIDFQLATRFGMEYTDFDGQKKIPYIIHRSSLGCYERTLALLIEKYAGAFPLWLAPVQVKVMNIAESVESYSKEIYKRLKEFGIRAELDVRNEKIGYKIREAQLAKIPYMIIIGDNEKENKTISIRGRGNENKTCLKLKDFIDRLQVEIANKIIN